MSWMSWPAWGFIGVVAQVLSLVALAGVFIELSDRRRRVAPVVWDINVFGSMVDGNGNHLHLAELVNSGSSAARLRTVAFVEATSVSMRDYRFRAVMGSGDAATIPLSADIIGNAWVVLVWTIRENKKMVFIEWLPVAQSGKARAAWEESFERTVPTPWRTRLNLWARRARPVGPGHYWYSSFRWDAKGKRFATAWSGLKGVDMMSDWSHITRETVDLPPTQQPD